MPKPTPVIDHDHGRFAGSLFAATVVMTVGLGVCLVIVFLFAPDAVWPLTLVVGGIVGSMVLVCLFNSSILRRARDSNLYGARRELVDNYVESFRPRHRRRSGAQAGTNKPPTADELRQIKEDSNAWYPSDRRVDEYRRNLKGGARNEG
ncbi:MAG TPA: hypothetical protein VHX68_17495 [Planctomycetaceae bacterium]|nr:hypothetical protein [Planctomycetaceae bacterium]